MTSEFNLGRRAGMLQMVAVVSASRVTAHYYQPLVTPLWFDAALGIVALILAIHASFMSRS